MLHWQDMKNFVEQISIKIGGFLRNQDEFGTNCAVNKQIMMNIRILTDISR